MSLCGSDWKGPLGKAGGHFSKSAGVAEQEQRNFRITFFNREWQGRASMKRNALGRVRDGSFPFKGKLTKINCEEFKVEFSSDAGEQNIKLPIHCKNLLGVLKSFWLSCLLTVIYSYRLFDQIDLIER